MELTDELVTPGCPQCFIKHMSTALAAVIQAPGFGQVDPRFVLLHRALINLIEFREGYLSHAPYVTGLLNMLEQAVALLPFGESERGFSACDVRRLRLAFAENPGGVSIEESFTRHTPDPGVLYGVLSYPLQNDPDNYAVAHVKEALRELPATWNLLCGGDYPVLKSVGYGGFDGGFDKGKLAREIQAALAAIGEHFGIPHGAEPVERNQEKENE